MKGAFDNVSYEAVLRNLRDAGCSRRTYEYVRDFLSNRTSTVSLCDLRSETFRVSAEQRNRPRVRNRPILFTIAMIRLSNIHSSIEGLRHAVYADDLTLWIKHGSPGHEQDALQEAVIRSEAYLRTCSLPCATEKSELLLLKARISEGNPGSRSHPERNQDA